MICSTAIRAVVLMTVMGLSAPAFAQDAAEDPSAIAPLTVETAVDEDTPEGREDELGFQTGADAPITTSQRSLPAEVEKDPDTDVPEAAMSIEHIDITVENKRLSVRSRRTDSGGVLIEASPVFTHLQGKVSIEGTVLFYTRYHDGAQLAIDMADGSAIIGGQVRGFLPGWKAQEEASTWLSPNAIAFLTGTEPKEDKLTGLTFTLADQLRPQFDLDLWIEGEQITNPSVEPRTIGPVLLVPLTVIAEALGHEVARPEPNVVSVRRLQDSTTILLNLSNGLVAVNNTPRGVTPDISFADPETLLLPFSAVETLTGTHIELVPGTDRIDVTLDDRLGGGVLPGERVVDEVSEAGFVPESLDFQLSDRGPANFTFSSRLRNFNTQLRYDSAGGLDDIRELQPAFVGLNVQSLDGWVGSIGDANTRLRELSGVGASRIRGLTWRKQVDDNGKLIALAAGTRSNGSVEITEDASRPTFGGFVAGARLLDREKSQDIGIGISLTEGADAGRVVVGGQKSIVSKQDASKAGLESVFISGDAGVFFAPQGTRVDARGRIQARGRITEQIGVQGSIDYQGGRFRQSDQELADLAEAGVAAPEASSSFQGAVSADWRARSAWGPIEGVAAGLRASHSRFSGDAGSSSSTFAGSTNAQIPDLGLSLSSDVSYSISNSSQDQRTTSRSVSLRAFKRFDWGNVQATYSDIDNSNTGRSKRLVSSLSLRPYRKNLGDGATFSAGPTASLVVAGGDTSARFGATVSANSGQKFGPKFNLQGQFSALQSIDPDEDDTQFFASLSSSYRITRNLQVEATYVETFDSNRDFSIALRGRVNFNEPRKYTRPKEGLGVLTGSVYFDRNRDGIRQENEPGVNSVRVLVSGTRLGLHVDRDGRFTIQNLQEGLYSLVIDRRSLPLGLVVPDDVAARATIAAGRITDLEIPIIASGQVRGALFLDGNGNSDIDPGEKRVEGMYITLTAKGETADVFESATQISASFGQYSFENVVPGEYELSVNFKGVVHTQTITLEEDDLFQIVPFALPGGEEGPPVSAPPEIETELSGEA